VPLRLPLPAPWQHEQLREALIEETQVENTRTWDLEIVHSEPEKARFESLDEALETVITKTMFMHCLNSAIRRRLASGRFILVERNGERVITVNPAFEPVEGQPKGSDLAGHPQPLMSMPGHSGI